METTLQKTVLHVGCGTYNPDKLLADFRKDEWKEIRLDINPDVNPDIIGDIRNLDKVESKSVDAIYSSHNLEHLFDHEVVQALKEFNRVLKPEGFAVITVPNIQKLGEYLTEDKLDDAVYTSPAGQVTAIDILYGYSTSIKNGKHYMAHKTAFTPKRLIQKFAEAGFKKAKLIKNKDILNIWSIAYK